MNILLWLLAVSLILAGIAGVVLPAVPGTPLVFLGMLLGAWIDGFQKVSGTTVGVLGVLTLISLGVDLAATAFGAKRVNASREAVIGAVIGTIVGLFGGFAGLIIGPFVGAAVGEFLARRDLLRAGQVGFAATVGLILGAAAKLAFCFVMVGLFVTAYLWK